MTSPGSHPNDTPHASDATSHNDDASRDDYRRLRDGFDGLDLEHQATFLVDAVASLIAKGLETAGRTLANEVDEFVERKRPKPGADESRETGPPGADHGSSADPDPSDKASTQASSASETSTPDSPPDSSPESEASGNETSNRQYADTDSPGEAGNAEAGSDDEDGPASRPPTE